MTFSRVAERMEALLTLGVPGCAISVRQDHKEVYRYVCGSADREGTKPLTGREAFYLFSCTKPITVAAAMQLVERGSLELDRPVADYLPEFAHMTVQQDGVLVPADKPISVRHLFTMSAGLDYDVESEPIRQLLKEVGIGVTTRRFVAAIAKKPLCFHPGERFQYSMCHTVLGAVIEAVSGMTFGDWLQTEMFAPLGMTETGFAFHHPTRAPLAKQYGYNIETGKVEDLGLEHPYRFGDAFEAGGSGLISTLDDYALFADAMACGGVGATGARILKPETVDAIRTEQLRKLVKDPTFSCAAGPGYGYGLGVRTLIDKSYGARSPLGEFGWDGADGAFLIVDPENRLSICFMQHMRCWPNLMGTFYAPIRDDVYDILGL